MTEELFDKKYVYFMWEDELEGKEGFVADDICELTNCVLGGNIHHVKVCKSLSPAFPFKDMNNNDWIFFYYDPNYECKRAYAEGKQIEIKNGKTWYNISDPEWLDDAEYRIKPEKKPRRMTNRELAKWLAQGNGQCMFTTNAIGTAYSYGIFDDREIPPTIKIRGWNETEWHEPIVQEADE